MFTVSFWVAFAAALLVSAAVAVRYGRHAIHPRLRPHFGQVLILFLLLALLSFCLGLVVSGLVGKPPLPSRGPTPPAAPPLPAPPQPGGGTAPAPPAPGP